MIESEIGYTQIGEVELRIITALERIATALEQGVLERVDAAAVAADRGRQILAGLGGDPYPAELEPVDLPPVAVRAPMPPIVSPTAVPSQPIGACPVHHTAWSRLVPAGTSKKTGKAYGAFWACPTAGCDQRAPR